MASSCPPTGPGHIICTLVQWPNIGPNSGGAGHEIGSVVGGVAGSALHGIADAAASAANGLLKTLSAMWMNVNTPNLSAASDLQTWTKWITTAVAVVCILIAAAQMVLRRRGEPAQVMFAGLARVVITCAAATFLVQTAGSLADHYSADMMNSTVAHLSGGGWSGVISTTLVASTIAPGDVMLLIIAMLIIISSLIQLMLMIMRIGLLIVLTGTLPLAAAASMNEGGQTWWRKHIGWLAAWLLYKPAAALLYVSAFRLTQGKALTEVLSGFMLLILAVLILPALLRVIVPATAHLGAGSGGHLAMATAGALATGAIRAGLHKPPLPARKRSPVSGGTDEGPSGAGVATGGVPPSNPSPSSPSAEGRTENPPATAESAEGSSQASRDGGGGTSSPSDGQRGGSSRTRAATTAATTAATVAAGLSANNASWRPKGDQAANSEPAGSPTTEPSSDGKRPGTARNPGQAEGGLDATSGPKPSGAMDNSDDMPRENGG